MAGKQTIRFSKMDGAGNIFVIIDTREQRLPVTDLVGLARYLARKNNPDTGGCDQVIFIQPSTKADCFMRIYNSDGSQSEACGNASRCVAWLLVRDRLPSEQFFQGHLTSPDDVVDNNKHHKVTIETLAGVLNADVVGMDDITVDMGRAHTHWKAIPLAQEMDTLKLPIDKEMLHSPAAVNMGNPHMVFFVPNTEKIPLERLGPQLEVHPLFPKNANVSVASIEGKEIWLRVWERGAGLTEACGTAACAAFVAAKRTGRLEEHISGTYVHLPGGSLYISIARHNDHVLMKGPIRLHFEQELVV